MNDTAHQAVEYCLAFLLAYTAIHRPDGSAAGLFPVAGALAALAAISPGRLAARRLLGHRGRRIAEAALAGVAVAVVVKVTKTDWLASSVLSCTAMTLVRVALTSTPPKPADRPASTPRVSSGAARLGRAARRFEGDLQPRLNRAARAAGVLVRNRRSNKSNQ